MINLEMYDIHEERGYTKHSNGYNNTIYNNLFYSDDTAYFSSNTSNNA